MIVITQGQFDAFVAKLADFAARAMQSLGGQSQPPPPSPVQSCPAQQAWPTQAQTATADATPEVPESMGDRLNRLNDTKVDWSYLTTAEGYELDGYVPWWPGAKNNNSGVTVATGVDLGGKSAKQLRNAGASEGLITKLNPYFGKTQKAAVDALAAQPLTIEQAEAEWLDEWQKDVHLKEIKNRYDLSVESKNKLKTPPIPNFSSLSSEQQTVLFSRAYNSGSAFGRSASETPGSIGDANYNFYQAVINGDWETGIDALQTGPTSRVRDEAAYYHAKAK